MTDFTVQIVNQMPRLKNFAYKLTKDWSKAEDLVQDTVLRAIEKELLYKKGTNIFSWLAKIQYNLFVSQYRRASKFESGCDIDDVIHLKSVDAGQESYIELQEIDKAIKSLNSEFQDVIHLVCIQNYKYEEVATILNIPVGTVRSRLHRAREELSAILKDNSKPNVDAHLYEKKNSEQTRLAA